MSQHEIIHIDKPDVDKELDKIKQTIKVWLDKFIEEYRETLVTEFNDPEPRGRVEKVEEQDSLNFKFITEFNFGIKVLNDEDLEKEKGRYGKTN